MKMIQATGIGRETGRGWTEYGAIAFTMDDVPAAPHLDYNFRTPNREMQKIGEDRTPFEAITASIDTLPVVTYDGEPPIQGGISLFTEGEKTAFNATYSRGCPLAINVGGWYTLSNYPDYSVLSIAWGIRKPDSNEFYSFQFRYDDSRSSRIEGRLYRLNDDYVSVYAITSPPLSLKAWALATQIIGHPWTIDWSVEYLTWKEYFYADISTIAPDESLIRSAVRHVSSTCHIDPGKAASELLQKFKLTDVNVPAFFVDLPEFGKSLPEIAKSLVSLGRSGSLASKAKAIGKANLSYQYGDRLTIADLSTLAEDARELGRVGGIFGPRDAKSLDKAEETIGGMAVQHKFRLTATAHPDGALEKATYLMANIFNYSNVWDMIPFSFVADWFVNIDDLLAAEDAKTIDCTMSYDRILRSDTFDAVFSTFNLKGVTISGTLTYYKRERLSSMPAPDAELQASIPKPVQWLNGASLLSQFKMKRRR